MSSMSKDRSRIRNVDRNLLEEFYREQPDYVPLVANRLGLHLDYADQRCDRLVELGLLKQVTGEAVYSVTDRGEQYLDGELDEAEFVADDD